MARAAGAAGVLACENADATPERRRFYVPAGHDAALKPDATRAAGFKAWLALGYCVRRGAKAPRIFAPCPPSKAKLEAWRDAGADPAEKPRTDFGRLAGAGVPGRWIRFSTSRTPAI